MFPNVSSINLKQDVDLLAKENISEELSVGPNFTPGQK